MIAALLLTAVLATVGYLVAKGMVIGGVTCAPVLAYGDDATPSSFVVMGSAVYEYAAEESDEWSRVPPVLPGKYRVRAVTERSFGRVSYSAPTPFTIEPRKVTVTVSEDSVPYGAMPTVSVELREGDQVDAVSLEFENLAISPNTPVHISKKTIRIVNADGVDVTSAYELTTLDKVVAVVPRPITVSTGSAEKEYDGAPLTAEKWSIVEGALVEGDTVETRFPSAVNVTGEAAVNQPVELVIRNADGEDVTHFYNVTGQWGSLTVKPRPVSVRTQPLNWTYLSPKVPDAGTAELDESTPLPDGYR